MLGTESLLQAYARLIADLGGYGAVSLYLPATGGEAASPPLLVHAAEEAVAELRDIATAEATTAALAPPSVSDDLAHYPGSAPGSALLRVPTHSGAAVAAGDALDDLPPLWVGLSLAAEGVPDRPTDDLWRLGGVLARHLLQALPILVDATTAVPGRAQFQVFLSQALRAAADNRGRVPLLLVNPDDFHGVNERHGRAAGDAIMVQVAERLQATGWPVFRFGAAVFAVFPPARQKEPEGYASDLTARLTAAPYLEGEVELTFSLGLAVFDPQERSRRDAALHLLLRADEALGQASRAGGARLVRWRSEEERSGVERRDRLSGIFTADVGRDYRNMLLLWDMVSVVTRFAEEEDLAGRVLDKLAAAFRPMRVELLEVAGEEGSLQPLAGRREPSAAALALAARSLDEGRNLTLDTRHAFPLIARDQAFGCLLVWTEQSAPDLDSADAVLLEAMASHLAGGLDRAALARQERRRREQERRDLRAELSELRHALQHSKLLHRSPAMDGLLARARKVAPSDATVLITGESGTGKELLARTLHQLSERRDRPCVLVDCGAIASSLIDSELFGHERGAYTSADQRAVGRLAQAEGGTVILDEVGELPLEVQSKLLRFVQEKQLTPVGASRSVKVDVRIVAVTNRDLLAEVRAGSFREDLYFRLNVVRLEVPPLRERREDVLFLARHFVKKLAFQYDKPLRGLSPAAEHRLQEHDWPGNVRELQNRLMQAVLLCEGETLGASDLQIEAVASRAEERGSAEASPFEALRLSLESFVRRAVEDPARRAVPLGRWLEEDLVLAADRHGDGVLVAAAERIGIPESTYRRRLKRVAAAAEADLLPRVEGWEEVRRRLASWLASPQTGDRLRALRRLLLAEIVAAFPGDVRTGAALMGVSEPTFRRWRDSDLPSPDIN